LKVSGRRETAGQSSISMMENRVLRGYQAEARGRGESEAFWPHDPPSVQRDL